MKWLEYGKYSELFVYAGLWVGLPEIKLHHLIFKRPTPADKSPLSVAQDVTEVNCIKLFNLSFFFFLPRENMSILVKLPNPSFYLALWNLLFYSQLLNLVTGESKDNGRCFIFHPESFTTSLWHEAFLSDGHQTPKS